MAPKRKKATAKINGLTIDVRILDNKSSYGNERYLVTPLKGTGQIWVDIKNITLKK